jgi:hypothetical protein
VPSGAEHNSGFRQDSRKAELQVSWQRLVAVKRNRGEVARFMELTKAYVVKSIFKWRTAELEISS